MNALIPALIQILIPEIASAIRAHHNATGNMPTDIEIIAALGTNAQRVVDQGEAWLTMHPQGD